MEEGYEVLADELKGKLINVPYVNQEEVCLEIEEIEEELNEEFEFDMRNEWNNVKEMKLNLGNKIEPKQDGLLCRMFDD